MKGTISATLSAWSLKKLNRQNNTFYWMNKETYVLKNVDIDIQL